MFFSSSTHKWAVLKQHIPITVKRISNIRWSAKYDAVEAQHSHLQEVIEALEAMRDGVSENMETSGDAGSILINILCYNFLSYLFFWSSVLKEVNDSQKYLQTSGLSLDTRAVKLEALSAFLFHERDNLVSHADEAGSEVCVEMDIRTEHRVRCRRTMTEEQAVDSGLLLKEGIRIQQVEIVDRLLEEIDTRSRQVQNLQKRFLL